MVRSQEGARALKVAIKVGLEDGFVTGFMDLLVRKADRYYLVDWKTNLLPGYARENLEREDGRGLFLMRALMDRVERFDANGAAPGGNVVRLTLARA